MADFLLKLKRLTPLQHLTLDCYLLLRLSPALASNRQFQFYPYWFFFISFYMFSSWHSYHCVFFLRDFVHFHVFGCELYSNEPHFSSPDPSLELQVVISNNILNTSSLEFWGVSEFTFVKYNGTYYTLAFPETEVLKVVSCTIFCYLFLSVSALFQVFLCAFLSPFPISPLELTKKENWLYVFKKKKKTNLKISGCLCVHWKSRFYSMALLFWLILFL